MCKGVYNTNPCELFAETVVGIGLPEIQDSDARTINFLVDTGSTTTVICPSDATRLGMSYDEYSGQPSRNNVLLPEAGNGSGVGGALKLFQLDSVYITLVSHDNEGGKERHTEFMETIYVAEKKYEHESLLGMDLLSRFRLIVDSEAHIVDFMRIPVKNTGYYVEHA